MRRPDRPEGNGLPSAEGPGEPARPASSTVLRNGRAPVIAWIVIGAATVAALLILAQLPSERAVALMGVPAVLAAVAWSCYLRPCVVLEPDSLTIVGVACSVVIPFARIDRLEVRLGLTVRSVDGRPYSAWALPSAGRSLGRDERGRLRLERGVPSSVQEVVSALSRWRKDSGRHSESGADEPIRASIRPVPPALLVLAVIWAVWGLRTAAAL